MLNNGTDLIQVFQPHNHVDQPVKDCILSDHYNKLQIPFGKDHFACLTQVHSPNVQLGLH